MGGIKMWPVTDALTKDTTPILRQVVGDPSTSLDRLDFRLASRIVSPDDLPFERMQVRHTPI
jgi:hypothetical protein